MSDGKSFLAVIPARAGSKRLPGKNLLPLAGLPLVGWTIDAALASAALDRCIVSTDDRTIAEFAGSRGLPVAALRPETLATDTATSADVVRHELDVLARDGLHFDYVVLLQPTSPLRTAQHIDAAIELACREDADSVVSVCRCAHHPYWSCRVGTGNRIDGFLGGELPGRASQTLPIYHRLNGAVYVVRTSTFTTTGSFFGSEKLYAFEMSPDDSVDIDTATDLRLAEQRISAMRAGNS